MKTKEELLNLLEKIKEYNRIRGFENWGQNNVETSQDALITNNFKESNNMCNFTLEFVELLSKYGVMMHGVNGMLVSFDFADAPKKYLGISPFFRWLQLTDEEMDVKIEEAKKEAEQKALKKNEEPINESDDECLFGCDDCYDTEEYDYEEESEEENELYDYDACGSFIADIEINVGKIELNEDTINDDLAQECWDRLLDALGNDDVEIDNDDDVFETLKFKILEDGTTLVKCKGAECSVRVDIQASCLDEANDERWSAFSSKVNSIDYLHNIREDYVSEAD